VDDRAPDACEPDACEPDDDRVGVDEERTDGTCEPGEEALTGVLTTTLDEVVARDEVQAEARSMTASRLNTERTAPTVPRPATAAAPQPSRSRLRLPRREEIDVTSRGGGFGGQPNMQQLMKQAQKMQQQLADAQAELAEAEVTGTAGGGLIKATVSGSGELKAIEIDPKAVDPDDVETLQDLVVAAVRDANRAVGELAAEKMGPVTGGLSGMAGGLGGLGLPGL